MVGREAIVSISSLGKATVGDPLEVACNVDDEVKIAYSTYLGELVNDDEEEVDLPSGEKFLLIVHYLVFDRSTHSH